jgi:hypothetical protein
MKSKMIIYSADIVFIIKHRQETACVVLKRVFSTLMLFMNNSNSKKRKEKEDIMCIEKSEINKSQVVSE